MQTGFELTSDGKAIASNSNSENGPRTAPGKPLPTRPWFMAVSLGSRPRCFGCGGRMLPKVVTVQADHAICEACSFIDWSDYRSYWDAIESLGSPLEITRSRGIVFWTPPPTLPDQDGYIRWMELWEIMSDHSARKLVSDR